MEGKMDQSRAAQTGMVGFRMAFDISASLTASFPAKSTLQGICAVLLIVS